MANPEPIYADIDSLFREHPVKREITRLTNEDAVKQSVRNIVLTNFYERPFQPWLGCGVRGLMFENISPLVQEAIQTSIKAAIENFEPRVNLMEVVADPDPDNNSWRVVVTFTILNNVDQIISVPVILKRVR